MAPAIDQRKKGEMAFWEAVLGEAPPRESENGRPREKHGLVMARQGEMEKNTQVTQELGVEKK